MTSIDPDDLGLDLRQAYLALFGKRPFEDSRLDEAFLVCASALTEQPHEELVSAFYDGGPGSECIGGHLVEMVLDAIARPEVSDEAAVRAADHLEHLLAV